MIFLAGLAAAHISAAELTAPKANVPRVAPASNEAELALKRFQVPPDFEVELFAAEPMFAHPVAFAIDEKNRFYIAESFRVGSQVTDIRGHMTWLDEELASTNTAQFRKLIEKYLDPRFMTSETERISLVEDTDRDGKADKSTVFADGFNDLTAGIAAGVLARKSEVWFACIPDLWHLRDVNGDGKAETRQPLQHGYAVRFGFYGHDLHGLRIGPDGRLYFSIGDRGLNVLTKEGKRVSSPEGGAVLRCNLDGSDLEIFATGLRNPQELAFDQYGNLFTGDNNSDGGDQARWVYLVEGGDSGWRIGWQFITSPVSRGPWNAEKMWHPQNDEQPAFIVPPLANLANGPSGLTFNPGPGLPAEYAHHFFMCDFRGTPASSLVHSFALKPKGAAFEVVDGKRFISQILATDVEFGMDGALYISDWVEGWGKTGKGRIYRMYHPQQRSNSLVSHTRDLMAHGFERRTPNELIQLLSWPDQRVRQEAQFELAARGSKSIAPLAQVARKKTNQLARLHAIWGLGQIARSGQRHGETPLKSDALKPMVTLLKDSDAEVRAQAAKVLTDSPYAPARRSLARLTEDAQHPRVQFFATMALGKLGGRSSAEPVVAMLRRNADQDAYLRHASVMALSWMRDTAALKRAAKDNASSVRLAALLALRRLESPEVAKFLQDPEPRVVLEAARAIYDLPIADALPDLAALARQPIASGPLLRRVINANYRIGDAASAQALAMLSVRDTVPEGNRVEALEVLGNWAKPSGRDRVTGLWRLISERDASAAVEALRPVLAELLTTSSDKIQTVAARLAGQYRLSEASDALIALAKAPSAQAKVRSEALRALTALNHSLLPELLKLAAESEHETLRMEAVRLLAKLNPESGAERLASALQSGTVAEKQSALLALGEMSNATADKVMAEWMDKLVAGTVPMPLQLELVESAGKRKTPDIVEKLARFEKSRGTNEIAQFVETLEGGNAAAGREIFFEKAEASCARCHKVGGEGGEAGPPLDKTLAARTREYLLESIIAPNKQIAPGYENTMVLLKNGDAHAGTVKSETETELVLNSTEVNGPVTIAKKDVETRRQGGSGMPEGVGELISKRDLRDLVEFLSTLK